MDSWTSPVFALRGFRTAYDCFCQKQPGIALINQFKRGRHIHRLRHLAFQVLTFFEAGGVIYDDYSC